MQRIAVVGSGGAGKSTFGRELGRLLGLPVIHLDHHYWRPGLDSVLRSAPDTVAVIELTSPGVAAAFLDGLTNSAQPQQSSGR